jgi:type I restriction enzyme M protein
VKHGVHRWPRQRALRRRRSSNAFAQAQFRHGPYCLAWLGKANCTRRATEAIGHSQLAATPTGIFYAQGVKANVLFFDRKPVAERPWTDKLWIYDLRTNKHFTLKENPLKRADLDDFVSCYYPKNRQKRKEAERFKNFTYEDLLKRDKLNLDIFWLKDESLEDNANLPPPDVIAAEIVEDLQAAIAQFAAIANDLKH